MWLTFLKPRYPIHCRHCHRTWYPREPYAREPQLPSVCYACKRQNWNQWPTASLGEAQVQRTKQWHQDRGHTISIDPEDCPICQEIRGIEDLAELVQYEHDRPKTP